VTVAIVKVGMTNSAGLDLDDHVEGTWIGNDDIDDLDGFSLVEHDDPLGSGWHDLLSSGTIEKATSSVACF
jgi:hypothetical protein